MECPEYTEELSRQFWMRVWSRVRIHSRIDSKANLSVLDKGFEKCFFFACQIGVETEAENTCSYFYMKKLYPTCLDDLCIDFYANKSWQFSESPTQPSRLQYICHSIRQSFLYSLSNGNLPHTIYYFPQNPGINLISHRKINHVEDNFIKELVPMEINGTRMQTFNRRNIILR